jgi:hypothetical protein
MVFSNKPANKLLGFYAQSYSFIIHRAWRNKMKSLKLYLILAITSVSFYASAAMLEQEVEQDFKKICIYSDGSTITVSSGGICPLTN